MSSQSPDHYCSTCDVFDFEAHNHPASVGKEIVDWLMGLEGALETTLRRSIEREERIQLRNRRGVYEGIADDIKRKWPQLFEAGDSKKG